MGATQNTAPFAKSRALLGNIAGVPRARVVDLQNPEADKPLAPHWRALWQNRFC